MTFNALILWHGNDLTLLIALHLVLDDLVSKLLVVAPLGLILFLSGCVVPEAVLDGRLDKAIAVFEGVLGEEFELDFVDLLCPHT